MIMFYETQSLAELDEARSAADLDGDLILDHVAGYLQVAVDQGHYLDYYLTHKQDE
jgi:hypothetical protein